MDDDSADKIWTAYVLSRKGEYLQERRRNIGPEYESDWRTWEHIFEQEWIIMEERLNAGFGVSDALKAQMGEDFFLRQLGEPHIVEEDFPEYEVEGKLLKIYTYEDFSMLSNAGLFREEEFLVDKNRKWTKKVIETLEEYGFMKVSIIYTEYYGGDSYIHAKKA